jgi:hypothetical protein
VLTRIPPMALQEHPPFPHVILCILSTVYLAFETPTSMNAQTSSQEVSCGPRPAPGIHCPNGGVCDRDLHSQKPPQLSDWDMLSIYSCWPKKTVRCEAGDIGRIHCKPFPYTICLHHSFLARKSRPIVFWY